MWLSCGTPASRGDTLLSGLLFWWSLYHQSLCTFGIDGARGAGRVYSLCGQKRNRSVATLAFADPAHITIYAVALAVAPAAGIVSGGWELRAGVLVEPDSFHKDDWRIFVAPENYGTGGETANFTKCRGLDLEPILSGVSVKVDAQWAACNAFFVHDHGVAHVVCSASGQYSRRELEGSFLFEFRGNSIVEVQFRLCLRREPRASVALCTQALHDADHLARVHPAFLMDWIGYHRHLGVDRFDIYDAATSFVGAKSFREVSYWPEASDIISSGFLVAMSDGYPSCVEQYVYSHCLINSFGMADWVLLLRSVDEYLHARLGAHVSRPFLSHLFYGILDQTAWRREQLGELHIVEYNFAATEERRGSGSVIASSLLRAPEPDTLRGVPVINPDNCVQVDGHRCLLSIDQDGNIFRGERRILLPPQLVQVNHYVEMLPQHVGRCSRICAQDCDARPAQPCDVPDTSLWDAWRSWRLVFTFERT